MKENPTQTIRAPERGPGSGGGIAPRRGLHPPLEPFSQQAFDMPGGHRVHVEQVGNPGGVPVVVLHGGPGGGCSPGMRRFFDPRHYRAVLFDQRGCGRSTPNASVENNTTWDLVADIERIREALGIERWIVFGGSWGACLALLYAQAHPERVTRLVLRGVFTMTRAELDWFYGGGAGAFWPEQWQAFSQMVPAEERHDPIADYHRRLFGADAAERVRFARAWAGWESALAVLDPRRVPRQSGERLCARLRPAREPLFHQRGLPRLRRADPARHAAHRAYSRAYRAGALRHDLSALDRLPDPCGLAGGEPHDDAGRRACPVRARHQRGAGRDHGQSLARVAAPAG